MTIPFEVSPQSVALGGVAGAGGYWLSKLLFSKGIDWWHQKRVDRNQIVKEWHSDVINRLNRIDSVGYRARATRQVPLDYITDLRETTVNFRNEVDPFPLEVRKMVDEDVLAKIGLAAALAFNLTHIPSPPEDTEPMSELIHHQIEILDRLDTDTDVTAGAILEFIDYDSVETDEIELSPGEAQAIIDDFERAVEHEISDADDVTVEELKKVPWESVDDVISKGARESIARLAINQLHRTVLLDKPREAKAALKKSREELFG